MNLSCNAVKVCAFGVLLAGFSLGAAPANADRVEKHFNVRNKPKITVRNSAGRIQVKAWTKSEVQVAWTNASGKNAVDTEQAGNRIEVVTRMTDENVARQPCGTCRL